MTHADRGDWVLVYGQVRKINESGVHPDDAVIEFFSHNEQWAGHVELKRIQPLPAGNQPDFIYQCSSMRRASSLANANFYARCERHDRHGGRHKSGNVEWTSVDEDGYFEEA